MKLNIIELQLKIVAFIERKYWPVWKGQIVEQFIRIHTTVVQIDIGFKNTRPYSTQTIFKIV